MRNLIICATLLVAAVPAFAHDAASQSSEATTSGPVAGVPVYPYDITDRPYKVIGTVTAGVRKATVFSHSASQEKIYQVLWKNAKKMGADAVIKATYGDSHVTAFSWGKTDVSGTAIKFVTADDGNGSPAATQNGAGGSH